MSYPKRALFFAAFSFPFYQLDYAGIAISTQGFRLKLNDDKVKKWLMCRLNINLSRSGATAAIPGVEPSPIRGGGAALT